MGSKSIVVLVALACIAALGAFFLNSGASRENATIERDAPSNVVVQRQTDDAVLAEADVDLSEDIAPVTVGRESLEAVAEAAEPGLHPWDEMLAGVTGRVLEEDGTPVVGIPVELLEGDANLLLAPDETPLGRPGLDVAATTTDAEGRFTIEGAAPTAFHALILDGGGGRSTVRFVEQSLSIGELTDVGDIVLPGFGTVIGTVIDEDGEPVPGARVRLAPVPEPVLQSGVLDLREDCVIAFGEGDMQKIDLPPWAAGVLERLPISTTLTAGDGTFRLEGVPLTTVAGGVDKLGFVATIIEPFELSEEEHDLDEIDLEVGRIVNGRVVDTLGNGVAGAEVRGGALHPMFKVGFLQVASAVTDDDGRFEVPGIGDLGQVVALARRDVGDEWVVGKAGGGSSSVDVILPVAAPLTVRVTSDAGDPIEGSKITVRPKPKGSGMFGMEMMGILGARGRKATYSIREIEPGVHVVDDLGLGSWVVRAAPAGFAQSEIEVVHSSEATACDVVCRTGRTVSLLVVDAATSEPIPQAYARILGPTETILGALQSGFTDDSGRIRLGPIARDGEESTASTSIFPVDFGLRLTVEHPRFGLSEQKIPPGEEVITVALTPACTLEGRVTWAGESPGDVYMAALTWDGGGESMIAVMSTPRTSLTNLEGSFRFTGLTAGSYELTVLERFLDVDPFSFMIERKEPEVVFRREVEVVQAEENLVAVELSEDGEGPKLTFEGRVVCEGDPVIGAKVSINGREDVELLTDAFGEFESEPMPAIGYYNVEIEGEVRLPDGTLEERTLYDEWVQPGSGEVHRVDVEIDFEEVVIEVFEEGTEEPIEGANVRLGNSSGTTGADGRATVISERAGEQSVYASASAYSERSKNIDLDPSAPAPHARIELRPSAPCAGQVILPPGFPTDGTPYLMVGEKGGRGNDWNRIDRNELTFELNGMEPGVYTARVWMNGSRTESVEFELGPAGDTNLVLQFEAGGS
ncbi:MAG: carboxypeptidase-like regulatory domain-containing protein [Planctomycetota bacterium]